MESANIPDQADVASNVSLLLACFPFVSKNQAFKHLQVSALKTLSRLLELVMEQEKKNCYKLAPESIVGWVSTYEMDKLM